jgi:NTE family protein
MTTSEGCLALVLGGGGARAAYQAGVLRAVVRRFPDLRFRIYAGVSAGSINTAILANGRGTQADAVEALLRMWRELDVSRVFRTSPSHLALRALRTGGQMAFGIAPGGEPIQGMVDTAPLRSFLLDAVGNAHGRLEGVAENVKSGRTDAVALTATRYATGQTVTFCAGRDVQTWERPMRLSVVTDLAIDHALASASLPLFFPAVRIGDEWYGDGGIRLVAPLAPAIHLGADKILAVSTCHARTYGEANRRQFAGAPAPAQILGVLYDAVFLDALDQDAAQLERVNQLLAAIPPGARHGLRRIHLLVVRPSADLGRIADEHEFQLPRVFRLLARRLGTRRARSQDMLSTVLFVRSYLDRLIELGERDGDSRSSEIGEFLAR